MVIIMFQWGNFTWCYSHSHKCWSNCFNVTKWCKFVG